MFDAYDVLAVIEYWRFFLALAVGVALGLAFYRLSGEEPSSAAIAFAIGVAGLIVGLIWQADHSRRDR